MLEIKRIISGANGRKSKYEIVNGGRDPVIIATFDTLEKAACVLRFLHGARLKSEEYDLAVRTLRELKEP